MEALSPQLMHKWHIWIVRGFLSRYSEADEVVLQSDEHSGQAELKGSGWTRSSLPDESRGVNSSPPCSFFCTKQYSEAYMK